MHETPDEIAELQRLLDASLETDNHHLLDIMTPERRLDAEQMTSMLVGMQVLVVATVTADGRPLTSCVDGHFLHFSSRDGDVTPGRHQTLTTRRGIPRSRATTA